MEDLKKLSNFDLVMKLNNINRIKGSRFVSGLELIAMDYIWNQVVMILWERNPKLKESPDIQPVLTNIHDALSSEPNSEHITTGLKKELKKHS